MLAYLPLQVLSFFFFIKAWLQTDIPNWKPPFSQNEATLADLLALASQLHKPLFHEFVENVADFVIKWEHCKVVVYFFIK